MESPLARHAGAWHGTNEFRLMTDDPVATSTATAQVVLAGHGRLASLAYGWTHPEDGDQDGLLLLGGEAEPPGLQAMWGDSWHQTPEPRVLTGEQRGAEVRVGYVYADEGWRWEVVVDLADPDVLAVRMDNVSPPGALDEAAERYAAMRLILRRSASV